MTGDYQSSAGLSALALKSQTKTEVKPGQEESKSSKSASQLPGMAYSDD